MKLQKKKLKTLKRQFQLLEVMIALFLVAVCAIPIMSSFVSVYQEQKTMQKTVELDHLLHLAHARLIEYLYLRGSKGDSLKELLTQRISIPQKTETGEVKWEELDQSPYVFLYELNIEKPSFPCKKPEESTQKLLLNVGIFAAKKSDSDRKSIREQSYKLFIERVLKEGQDEFQGDYYKSLSSKETNKTSL